MSQGDYVRRLDRSGTGMYGSSSSWFRFHIDGPLFFLLLVTLGGGLAVLFSAGGESLYYVKRQAVWCLIALTAMVVVAQISPRFMARWAIIPWLLGVCMLAAVLIIGSGAKGAQRWLEIAGFRFQPSELLKIAVPLMLSSYLGSRVLPPTFKHVCWSLVLIAIPPALVILQPDLGTSLLIGASGFFVLLLAGLPMRYILSAAAVVAIAVPLMWFYGMHDYQRQRVLTMFNPEADKLGAGWNIIQSTTAIGSGGFQGKGWLSGSQAHLEFLPERHTDFIIAVMAEEFGFIGVMVLLTVYLLIIIRCLVISLRARNMFGKLLAGSITLTFFVYIFVNMGMVSGILPVVGVPLPMISYGGTSLVTLMLGFGMLMAIGTEEKRGS